MVQLGLHYTLSYTLHHQQQQRSSSLTMHPSSAAREHIRQTLLEYASSSASRYRFVDYFCVLGCTEPRLSSSPGINVPCVLTRFPELDHSDAALPEEIAMFAFSDGFTLSSERQREKLYSFRLNCDLDQMMVSCLMFWEEQTLHDGRGASQAAAQPAATSDFILPETEAVLAGGSAVSASEGESARMFVPRVLLLTSRLSYVSQHCEILSQLYQHFFSPPDSDLHPAPCPAIQLPCAVNHTAALPPPSLSFPCSLSCPCTAPIRLDCTGQPLETYLTLLTSELPLPVPGGRAVDFSIACRSYRLCLPASELDFPHLEFDLYELFQVLDVETVLTALRCLLSEMRVILHSGSRALLHSVSESLIALCFPFTWSHVFVPLLPRPLLAIVEAPVSFMIGIQSAAPPDLEHITDLTPFALIDIDRSTIDVAQPPPAFPAHAVRVLLKGLRRLVRPSAVDADDVRLPSTETGPAELYRRLHPSCADGRCSRVDAAVVTAGASSSSPSHPPGSAPEAVDPSLARQEARELSDFLLVHERNRLIRYEFFGFLSSLLHGYREHLHFLHGLTPTFSTSSFLAACPSSDHLPFLSRFLETQLFRDFLDRHVEMPSYLQDYLTYVEGVSEAAEGRQDQAFRLQQTPPRTLDDWTALVHPAAPTVVTVEEEQEEVRTRHRSHSETPAHWSSLTAPIAEETTVEEEASDVAGLLPRPSLSVRDSGGLPQFHNTGSVLGASSSLTSPIVFHGGERLNSCPPSASLSSSGVLPDSAQIPFVRTRSSRSATVVSLAPAVTAFVSSQTIVTAAASAVEAGREPPPSHPASALCYRQWLLRPPREFRLPEAEAGGAAGGFAAAKNPSTLLHAPLPAMAINADGEIEIVGGIRPPEAGGSKGAKAESSRAGGAAVDDRRSIVINTHAEGGDGSLTIAINSPKPVSNAQRQAAWASPAQPVPTSDAQPAASQLSATVRPRRLSRQDSLVNRPQSTNLISKSELELRKPEGHRRLPQLLAAIFRRHGGGVVIDVGELSAVGELLALREWRAMLVDLIGRLHGGYEGMLGGGGAGGWRDVGRERERCMEAEGFSALLLLFNVALEECAVENDFANAYSLLLMAERVYTSSLQQPQQQQQASAAAAQPFPPPPPTPHHNDRVYLLHSLASQALWHSVPEMWTFAYQADVHRRQHAVFPSQPCTACQAQQQQPAQAGAEEKERAAEHELCVDVLCHLIGLQVALGCREERVASFVQSVCSEHAHLLPQRAMLLQLVHSTIIASRSMMANEAGDSGGIGSERVSPSAASAVHPLILPQLGLVRRSSFNENDAGSKGDSADGGRIGTGIVPDTMRKYQQGAVKEFRIESR